MKPKVSILLPTYNGAPFLARQLDSILAQDDGDFELLAIDDGSTDATVAILADYAARDPRVRHIAAVGNLGQNNRLRALLAEATGAYIAVADQDDIWAPDRNRLLLAALDGAAADGAAPARPALAFGRSELIDAAGRGVGVSLLQKLGVTPDPTMRLRALLRPMVSAHAAIVRRDRIDVAALASPLSFDWLIALEAIFSDGLAYVDAALVFHRIHGGNQMNRIDLDGGRRRISAATVRNALLFRRPARLNLWLVLDFLGRSTVLRPADRRMFATLAGRCHAAWFSEWRPLRPANTELRTLLTTTLAGFAGSAEDAAAFDRQVATLTATVIGRTSIGAIRRRLAADFR